MERITNDRVSRLTQSPNARREQGRGRGEHLAAGRGDGRPVGRDPQSAAEWPLMRWVGFFTKVRNELRGEPLLYIFGILSGDELGRAVL